MEFWLATSPVPGVILWIILYISDYSLTIYSARGFREIGHFQFEGSFELTPQFQKDVDALKPVSKRHLILLVFSSLLIIFIWWITSHATLFSMDIFVVSRNVPSCWRWLFIFVIFVMFL